MGRSTTIARLSATGMWSVSLALMVLGLIEGQDPMDLYAWSIFLSMGACVPSGWLITEHLTQREYERASACIAAAVGEALADRLEAERGLTLVGRR